MRKLANRNKRASKKDTWYMTYTDDNKLLAFSKYSDYLYSNNNYFEGTKRQIRKEAKRLGIDFSEWNKDNQDNQKDLI